VSPGWGDGDGGDRATMMMMMMMMMMIPSFAKSYHRHGGIWRYHP